MIAVSHHIGNQKFSQQCRHVSTEQRKILELLPRHWQTAGNDRQTAGKKILKRTKLDRIQIRMRALKEQA